MTLRSWLASFWLAAIILTAPAAAGEYQAQLHHLDTANGNQDQLCDLERGMAGQCNPFAVNDKGAHVMTALPSFAAPPATVVQIGSSATTTAIALSAANGGQFSVTGGLVSSGPVTYTLPASSTLSFGWRFTFKRDSGIAGNVVTQGSDTILAATVARTYTGLQIGPANGDFMTLVYEGFGHFEVENASPAQWSLIGAASVPSPPQGSFSYLEANTYTPGGVPSTVVIAQNLIVVDPIGGTASSIPSINTTDAYCAVGPIINGRDDGSSCQPYESGYIYIVRNPSTGAVGSVRSTQSFGPKLTGALAGYTQWAGPLFFYVSDNSHNPFSIEGYGKAFWFTNDASAQLINLAQGVAGSVSLTTMAPSNWANVSVAPEVPDIARNIFVAYGCSGTGTGTGHLFIAPGNTWSAPQPNGSLPNPSVPYAMTVPSGATDIRFATITLKDEMGRAFAYAADRSDCFVQLQGWSF